MVTAPQAAQFVAQLPLKRAGRFEPRRGFGAPGLQALQGLVLGFLDGPGEGTLTFRRITPPGEFRFEHVDVGRPHPGYARRPGAIGGQQRDRFALEVCLGAALTFNALVEIGLGGGKGLLGHGQLLACDFCFAVQLLEMLCSFESPFYPVPERRRRRVHPARVHVGQAQPIERLPMPRLQSDGLCGCQRLGRDVLRLAPRQDRFVHGGLMLELFFFELGRGLDRFTLSSLRIGLGALRGLPRLLQRSGVLHLGAVPQRSLLGQGTLLGDLQLRDLLFLVRHFAFRLVERALGRAEAAHDGFVGGMGLADLLGAAARGDLDIPAIFLEEPFGAVPRGDEIVQFLAVGFEAAKGLGDIAEDRFRQRRQGLAQGVREALLVQRA